MTLLSKGSTSMSCRNMASMVNRRIPPEKDCTKITPPYTKLAQNLSIVQQEILKGRSLSLAEKILYGHLRNPHEYDGGIVRGETYLKLKPGKDFFFNELIGDSTIQLT